MAEPRTSNVGLLCEVPSCGQPRRKRVWCGSHYAQWHSTGEVKPFTRKWATERRCVVCGVVGAQRGYRKFCSARCSALSRFHHGQRPTFAVCIACDRRIDLLAVGRGGRRRRCDIKLCDRCKRDYRKHGVSVGWLAKRDGTGCGICAEPVDMTLTRPDLMSPSVDHIVPRACGGTNDPANLQLAHLLCNHVKSDRHHGVLPRSGERQVGRRG